MQRVVWDDLQLESVHVSCVEQSAVQEILRQSQLSYLSCDFHVEVEERLKGSGIKLTAEY